MDKKHVLYLFFQIRSTLKTIPKLLISAIIFSLIIAMAGYSGSKVYQDKNSSSISISVAAVVDKEDPWISMGLDLLDQMESIKSVCTIIQTDKESARQLLQEGKVAAVIILPPGFVDGIMNGENFPATIMLPVNADMETLLFCSVLDAGANTLAYVQSGIYAVDDLLWAHGHGDAIADAEDYLNDFYMKYTLNRGGFFEPDMVSATGAISMQGYFICSGILFIMLLCGLTITDVFSGKKQALMESLRVHGISKFYLRLSEFLSVTLLFTLLFGVVAVLAGIFYDSAFFFESPAAFGAFLLVVASVVSFLMFLSCVADSGLVSTLLIFLFATAMMYAGGRIIPSAFLPDSISKIGIYLPVTAWCNLLESVFYSQLRHQDLWMAFLYTAGFFGISILVTYRKGRKQA